MGIQQGLQLPIGALQLMQHHMLRLTIVDKVGEGLELFFWYLQRLYHSLEQVITMTLLVATELHQSEQQQRLLAGFDLSVQGGTDRTNAVLSVKNIVIHQVIRTPQVAIETQIGVDITDTELVTQIVD